MDFSVSSNIAESVYKMVNCYTHELKNHSLVHLFVYIQTHLVFLLSKCLQIAQKPSFWLQVTGVIIDYTWINIVKLFISYNVQCIKLDIYVSCIYTDTYIITKPIIMIIFGCVKVNACTNTNNISKSNKKLYKKIYSKDVLRHSVHITHSRPTYSSGDLFVGQSLPVLPLWGAVDHHPILRLHPALGHDLQVSIRLRQLIHVYLILRHTE